MGVFHELDGQTFWIGRKSYLKPDWPLSTLEPGGSFFIPMSDGLDATGRTEPLIRAYIACYSRSNYTKHHVHRVDGGILVMRSTKPHIRSPRLR